MQLADFRIFIEPQQGTTYEAQLAVAQRAESLGFGAFFRSDHYLKMGNVSGLPGPTDSWVTLAGLARETSTIRLGTLVSSATFRFPGPLAISVAQVDRMSGGRVELGLGAGWYEAEHSAHAIPFPPLGERFERLEEQLAIVNGLWGAPEGSMFSFDGRHYQVTDSPGLPKPAQAGGPPIIVGGNGPRRTPSLAARYAAEFNLGFQHPERFAQQRDNVRAACGDIGRDPDALTYSVALPTCVGADEAEYARRAGAIGRDPTGMRAEAAIAGLPDEAVAMIRRYLDAGAQRVYLQILDLADLDHLDLLATAVVPGVG